MTHMLALGIGLLIAGNVDGTQEQQNRQATPPRDPLACFVARVKWVEVVGTRDGQVVPIGVLDLNWVVGLDIVAIEKPAKSLDKKGELMLLIHSPAILFGRPGEESVGKEFYFRVFGKMEDNELSYRYAEATEKKVGKGTPDPLASSSNSPARKARAKADRKQHVTRWTGRAVVTHYKRCRILGEPR